MKRAHRRDERDLPVGAQGVDGNAQWNNAIDGLHGMIPLR